MATHEVVGRTGTTVTVPLVRGRTFAVRLVKPGGAPLAGVRLTFAVAGDVRPATTGPDGVARVVAPADEAGVSVVDPAELRAAAAAAAGAGAAPAEGAVRRAVDGGFEEVRVAAGPPVDVVIEGGLRCFELPGPHFDFDRSFVRPDGMAALAAVVEALADPTRQALVFGHTDTVGAEDYNKRLSERRARVVHAALTHDPDAWEEVRAAEGWGLVPTQVMLNAVNDGSQPACPEGGAADAAHVAAVKAFQRRADHAPLKDDGDAGPLTRRALVLLYLKRWVPSPIAGDRFRRFAATPFMGCGEFNPFTAAGKDELSRRVVVLVHAPDAAPAALPCAIGSTGPCLANLAPGPGGADPTPHFRCAVYRGLAKACPCGQAGAGELVVNFVDAASGAPLVRRPVVVEHADGRRVTHETNAQGKIVISDAKPGTYRILEYANMPAHERCSVTPPGGA